MKRVFLIAAFLIISFAVIPGCGAPLSNAQILQSAAQSAVARGIRPEDYDISIDQAGTALDDAPAAGAGYAGGLSQKVKSITGSDSRTVIYSPKSSSTKGSYIFYINKNTGKLVMVLKRK